MTTDIVKTEQRNNSEIELIHNMYAKNSSEEEFKLFMYTANKFGLDPLLKQIWCVKFANQNAQIYAGRDGFLEIAHRSGQFDGIESGMKNETTAYAKVYRKDMTNPFYVEVDMSEYSTNQALWKSKPKTMLTKVAESQALRRAFSITGIYSPEEMGQWELEAQGIKFETTPIKQIANTNTQQPTAFDRSKLDPNAKPNTKINATTNKPYCPTVQRLYAIATKTIGMSADEFKTLCINITDKQHSNEYTNQDCWNIEDAMNKPVEPEPEFIDVESVSQDELKADYNDIEKHFENTLGAVETVDSVQKGIEKTLGITRK